MTSSSSLRWDDDFAARLQELTNRIFDTQRLIEAIPLTVTTAHELSSKTELIQKHLSKIEASIEDGYFFAAECDSGVEAKQVTQQLDKNKTFVADLKNRLRQAKLQCRQSLQRRTEAARDELLSKSVSARRANELVHDKFSGEVAQQRSRQSTEALRRTREIVANEIARTSEALDTLGRTNKTLEDTYGEHRDYANTLRQGKHMITQLERRDRTDKWLVTLGFAFFCLCVLYIVKRRLAPSASFLWSLLQPLLDMTGLGSGGGGGGDSGGSLATPLHQQQGHHHHHHHHHDQL